MTSKYQIINLLYLFGAFRSGLKVPSISRNPKLAYIFYKTGLVEERGIGMRELKAFKDNNDLPDPEFNIEDEYFIITIFRKMAKVSLNDLRVFIKQHDRISTGDYAKKFGVSAKTASRALNKYVDEGVLGREGEKRGTKYFLQ